MQTDALFARWARAWPATESTGELKQVPEDFVVAEQADFESQTAAEKSAEDDAALDVTGAAPQGNHLYLYLQKRNKTTRELVRDLADANGLPISAIGYAGMKDKRAVTRQWVSVPTSEGEGTGTLDVAVPDDSQELARVLQMKKLRRGWHNGNRFEIVLRKLAGTSQPELAERLQLIKAQGVPNYFAEQRFGRDNLTTAIAWLPRRRRERNAFKKGLYLSVLRSFLFNEVLSARLEDGSWNTLLADEQEAQGPLWGRGRVQASAAVIALERAALADHREICNELEFAGLHQERRSLVLGLQDLSWEFPDEQSVRLEFALPPGTYATAVLRELGRFTEPAREEDDSGADA